MKLWIKRVVWLAVAGVLGLFLVRAFRTAPILVDVGYDIDIAPALEVIDIRLFEHRNEMSDGAGAVVVMSREKADQLGLNPMARFVSFAVGGVRPEIMGIGPVAAIPKALKYAGLTLDDIDLIELNEAFAAQAVAVIREMEMDEEIVNVNGGAVALGHPLGATGAKLTTQLLHEMQRRGCRYGMVTMCIGGGMGAAGIFEILS